jgi:hypothetical protein
VISNVQHTAGASITGLAADPNTCEIAATPRRPFTRFTRWTAFTDAGFLALGLLASTRVSTTTPPGEAKVAETSTG